MEANYARLSEQTTTSCARNLSGIHNWKWSDRPGQQVCECGMTNWNPCDDERVFPKENTDGI